MKIRWTRLMFTGAVAWLVAIALATIGTTSSRPSSIPSFNRSSQIAWPLGGVAFAQSQNKAQAAPKLEMSEAVFKNVQVLKGIPVDEFMGTMGLFSAALSACCGDCHTGAGGSNPDWAADPPRKKIARRMVTMVNAINHDNFGGSQVVTCWTCHRGTMAPAATPPLDTIYSTPVVPPPDVLPAGSGVPTADQIFDKYIQALGGADKLAQLTSYTAKGTSTLYGEDRADPAEIYATAPDRLATLVHEREGDLARTFDGRDAWVMLPLTVLKEYPLTASALEGAKLDAELAFPGRIKQFLNNWRVSFPITLDNRDVWVVQGTGAGGLLGTFYFDKQSGLLTRVVYYAHSAVGRVPTQIDYSDYRPVAGVMMPFKWTFGWVSGREDYALTEVQPNVAVNAGKFAKPVQRAQ